MRKLPCLLGRTSSEESSTESWPSTGNDFPCEVCGRNFSSLGVLGVHQNAHRLERNQTHNYYMQNFENLPNTAQEEPIHRPALPAAAAAPPPVVALPEVRDQEIDLELRLTCGPPPPPKPYYYYEFVPIRDSRSGSPEKIYDKMPKRYCPYPRIKSAHTNPFELFPDPELPLMGGARHAGGGRGSYLGEVASQVASSLSSREAHFTENLTLN